MTEQQIKWAASHDWFVSYHADSGCLAVIDEWIDRDGQLHIEGRRFFDFAELRAWAGY